MSTQPAWVASPCIAATSDCTEWIVIAGGPSRALVYRSYALERHNPNITRALVNVHGGSRDAHTNFMHSLAAAFLAGALNDTVIVSPRFASNHEAIAKTLTGEDAVAAARAPARDTLADYELNWVSQFGGRHWNAGGVASNAKVTSYEVIDEIQRKLANKSTFPNIKSIVVAGHSSGGQFVGRYQMVNRVHEQLGVKVTYVVSNPGAYTYLDHQRPTASAIPPNVSSTVPGFIDMSTAKPPPPFQPYADARHCATYDTWPYGMKDRVGYAAQFTDEELIRQAVSRPTTYVLGELDILPLVNFDISCPAMAQGNSRLARGLAFSRYIRDVFGAKHPTVVLDGCGHSTRCMLTHDRMLPILFPKE
jgi:hypothetical protein